VWKVLTKENMHPFHYTRVQALPAETRPAKSELL
jgi:hypothetical protein